MDNALTLSVRKWRDRFVQTIPRRYSVGIFIFFGTFFIYTMRANLSVSIEPMSCKYRWSNKSQGYALSSFFIGYFLGNAPGGYLSEKYGARFIYGTGLFITALLTLLVPSIISSSNSTDSDLNCKCDESIAKGWVFIDGHYQQLGGLNDIVFDTVCDSESHFYLLCIARILTGLFESVAFPSSYYLLNQWTISSERSRFVSLNQTGTAVGTAFTLFLCPILIESHLFGWEYTFYSFAWLAMMFIVLWYHLLFNTPAQDPWIQHEELLLIKSDSKHKSEMQLMLPLQDPSPIQSPDSKEYPWRAFLTHPVALALYTAHFCTNWTNYFILTMLPTYINKQLNYDLSTSAFINVMPLTLRTLMCVFSSFVVDRLIGQGYNRWNVRRIAQILATVIPGAILVLCSYVSSSGWAILCMSLSICISGCVTCGHQSVFVEVSPTLSNVMYGISNTIATVPGIISPIFSGYILGDNPGNEEWKFLFYVAFVIHVIGVSVFCYYGSAHKIAALNKV